MNYPIAGVSLGLTQKERDSYSVAGLIRAVAENRADEKARYAELSRAVAQKTGQSDLTAGYYLPSDILGVPQQRTMTTTSGPAGGYNVGVEIAGYSAALNKASLLSAVNITRLDNLRSDVVIASQSLQHQTVWVAEGNEANPTQGSLGQISMMPKTAISMITVSKQLLYQMGEGDRAFIDRQLGVSVAEAIDAAILQGSGAAGEPLGILGTANVDSRTGNAFDMAAGTGMLKVAEAFANDDSVAWVSGVDAAATLRARLRTATYGNGFMVEADQMLGKRFIVSRSMPAAKLICAPWSSVMLGSWGAPLLKIDPSAFFTSGAVRVGVFTTIDVAVERPQSIAIATAVS